MKKMICIALVVFGGVQSFVAGEIVNSSLNPSAASFFPQNLPSQRNKGSKLVQSKVLLDSFSENSNEVHELLSKISLTVDDVSSLQDLVKRADKGDIPCQYAVWQCCQEKVFDTRCLPVSKDYFLVPAIKAQYPPALFEYGKMLFAIGYRNKGSLVIWRAAQACEVFLNKENTQPFGKDHYFYLPAVSYLTDFYLQPDVQDQVGWEWWNLEKECKNGNQNFFE